MDTKELMIGDFVRININDIDAFIAKVSGIWTDGAIMVNGIVSKHPPEYVEPIILTDDILNQIAEYLDYRDSWVLKGKGGQLMLDVCQRADGHYYFLYTDDEALWRGDYFACCRYVHELQHVLRVTGHGDLADNFI